MCTRPIHIKRDYPPSVAARYGVAMLSRDIDVPCGKCAECLAARQNEVAIRVMQEASKASSVHFFTFTYREEDLPLAHSVWRTNHETGETDRVCAPEHFTPAEFDDDGNLKSGATDYDDVRAVLLSQAMDGHFRQVNTPLFRDENGESLFPGYDYYRIVTPTLLPRDPRMAIKRFRIEQKRNNTPVPDDFKYLLVGEYGTRFSRRPHYHMVAFNLTDVQANSLAAQWKYGDVKVDHVYDKDGDISKVARYVGKYAAKGRFCDTSFTKSHTINQRICASKHLGKTLTEAEKAFYLATDTFDYNPESLDKVDDTILAEIKNRLNYPVRYKKDGVEFIAKYKLPQALIEQIFTYDKKDSKGRLVNTGSSPNYLPIWFQVKDFIRTMYTEHVSEEFKEFCSNYSSEDLSLACAAFDAYQKNALRLREENRRKRIAEFYSTKGVF